MIIQLEQTIESLRHKRRLQDADVNLRNVHNTLRNKIVELREVEKNTREKRLNDWKTKVRTDLKFVSRWLRSRDNPGLTHVRGPDGEPLAKQAAVEEIKHFWIDFWNDVQARSPPNDQITDHLLQTAVSPPPVPWVAPTPMQLMRQASFAKGAPGADGWTGSEVASLPVEAWTVFHSLSQRWLRSGQLPQALLGARIVFVAKAGKQQNGMVKAGDTRPITVLSCFWRTWLSAWLKLGLWRAGSNLRCTPRSPTARGPVRRKVQPKSWNLTCENTTWLRLTTPSVLIASESTAQLPCFGSLDFTMDLQPCVNRCGPIMLVGAPTMHTLLKLLCATPH